MSTHQKNSNVQPDTEFIFGEVKYLVAGNSCRLLDQRRTPGVIEFIDMDSGFFQWKILDFEDRGKIWEVPFEDVKNY